MKLPQFLINSQQLYVVKLDTNGKITFRNELFHKKFSGSDIIQLIAASNHSQFNKAFKDCIAGKNNNVPIELLFQINETAIPICWEFNLEETDTGTKEVVLIGYNSVSQNTDKIETEQELENIMMENFPGLFYLFDETRKYLKWNKNLETVSGYTGEEIATMHPLMFFTGQDDRRVDATIEKVFSDGFGDVEANIITKDHQSIPYYFNGKHIVYNGKNCLIGAGIDMTKLAMAQEEIIESEKKYHSLFEQASDPIMLTDFNGNFNDVNESMCRLFGYTKEELLQMNISQLIDPDQLKKQPVLFDLLATGQQVFNRRDMLHKNGTIISVEANVKKFNENNVMAIARDVTELDKVRKQIEISESTFRGVFENSAIGMALSSPDGKWIKVNKELCNITGYTEAEMLTLGFLDITHPDDRDKNIELYKQCLVGEIDTYRMEKRYYHKNKSIIWVHLNISLVKDSSGKPLHFISQVEDITEQKEAEIKLKEAELKFRDLVEKSLAGVYIMQDGKYMYVNPRFAEIFGYKQNELIGQLPLEVAVADEDKERVLENIRKRLEGEMDSIQYQLRGQQKDGTKIWLEVFGNRTMYGGKPAIIGTLIDISRRKQAEAENEQIRYMLNERVKELTTLYKFGQVLQTEQPSMKILLQELVTLLPPGWQYPEITAARIVFDEIEIKTPNFSKGPHKQNVSFQTPDGKNVTIEVIYLEKRPEAEEGAFLKEERHLINMLAEMFRIYLTRKEESEALKKSEANLHTIFDTTDTVFILMDKKFRIISYNKPAINFTAKELNYSIKISDLITDYLPHERSKIILKQMKKALAGEHVNYEAAYPQQDGSTNWYDVRMLDIAGDNGEVFGIILAVLDITEKKLLEASMVDQKVQEQKKISRAIIKAQEKQKNYIGQELHDNVNQILVGAKLFLNLAARQNESVKDLIKYPIELLDNSLHEIRMLSSRQTTPLKNIRLKDLIQTLLHDAEQNIKVKTSFVYGLPDNSINDDLKLNIYRIIQELVNNMTKYAGAKNFSVSLLLKSENINLLVTDDGSGFNITKKRKGIGISNMTNRVEAFNGKLSIETLPGKGTKTFISIPPIQTGKLKINP